MTKENETLKKKVLKGTERAIKKMVDKKTKLGEEIVISNGESKKK